MAEVSGYKATLLSGATFANAQAGLPDVGLITADDLVRGAQQVCAYSPLPCIIDADDGYGETPIHAYRTAKRLAEAGAMAFSIEDSTGFRGFERWFMAMRRQEKHIEHPVVSRQVWLAKIKAALDACRGTDCMVIARTEAKVEFGIDEAIERALLAHELGADMTLVIGISTEEEAQIVGERVPGWKMWPDVMSRDGKPDVELKVLEQLGFNLVTCHVLEKGAMNGMLDYGRRTIEDGNTVYHDTEKLSMPYIDGKLMNWIEKETAFNDVKTSR